MSRFVDEKVQILLSSKQADGSRGGVPHAIQADIVNFITFPHFPWVLKWSTPLPEKVISLVRCPFPFDMQRFDLDPIKNHYKADYPHTNADTRSHDYSAIKDGRRLGRSGENNRARVINSSPKARMSL
jgi:hypothetical protein